MTYNYPFFSFPHFRRYPNYYHAQYPYTQENHGANYQPAVSKEPNLNSKNINPTNAPKQEDKEEDEEFFELLGLKLHNDDILLLGLIFFLYKEDVKDQYLFFALILLLLS